MFQMTVGRGLLLFAAFTSVLTALMGLFLSKENGYSQESLQWHKWSGVFVCWISLAWYTYFAHLNRLKYSVDHFDRKSWIDIVNGP